MTNKSDRDTPQAENEEVSNTREHRHRLEDEGYRRLKREQGFEEISEVVHYYEEEYGEEEQWPPSDVSDVEEAANFPPAMGVPQYIVVDRDVRGATYDTRVAGIENSVIEIEQEVSGISSDISLMNENIAEVARNHGKAIKRHETAFSEVEDQVAILQEYHKKLKRRQERRSRAMRLTYLLLAVVSVSGAISAWRLGLGGVPLSFRILTVVALIVTSFGLVLAATSANTSREKEVPF